jgi:hypothetical protein
VIAIEQGVWFDTIVPATPMSLTVRFTFLKALVFALTLLEGCVMGTQFTPPGDQKLAAIGYGALPTVDYKKAIQAFFLDSLKGLRAR